MFQKKGDSKKIDESGVIVKRTEEVVETKPETKETEPASTIPTEFTSKLDVEYVKELVGKQIDASNKRLDKITESEVNLNKSMKVCSYCVGIGFAALCLGSLAAMFMPSKNNTDDKEE